jgi:triosephosphate isomerase
MTQRKALIAGNWKMHKTGAEAVQSAERLVERVAGVTEVEAMIAPPFTALAQVAAVLKDTNVALGAQNCFWETRGAYTGEIAPAMLTAAGCRYVIVGHSERRQYFNETDQTVNRRIAAALVAGLRPILCVGETEAEREAGDTYAVLVRQMSVALQGFEPGELDALVVAYEPVWAIGTGKAATSDMAQEAHAALRAWLEKSFGAALAKHTRILYGGSVKPNNVKDLMAQPDLDGALVGGASLDPDTFSELVRFQKI